MLLLFLGILGADDAASCAAIRCVIDVDTTAVDGNISRPTIHNGWC